MRPSFFSSSSARRSAQVSNNDTAEEEESDSGGDTTDDDLEGPDFDLALADTELEVPVGVVLDKRIIYHCCGMSVGSLV